MHSVLCPGSMKVIILFPTQNQKIFMQVFVISLNYSKICNILRQQVTTSLSVFFYLYLINHEVQTLELIFVLYVFKYVSIKSILCAKKLQMKGTVKHGRQAFFQLIHFIYGNKRCTKYIY